MGANFFLIKTLVLLALAAALAAPARADGPDHANADYARDAVKQAGAVVTAPLRWDGSDWLEAGAVAGAAGGLYAGADIWARKTALRNRSDAAGRAAGVGRALGNGFYLVPALAAAYAGGEAAKDKRLRRASLDAFESFAISGLLVTGTKMLAGRNRPDTGNGRGDWDGPGAGDRRYSFPSGHSSSAFAVATTFATAYGDVPGVAPAAYALASLTAVSRVYNDKHWASDVFVGGALGYFTAKAVASSRRGAGGRWAFTAFPAEHGAGAALAWRFD